MDSSDESEESNPFSFREFLRTKNHDRDQDLVDDRGRDEDASVWEVCDVGSGYAFLNSRKAIKVPFQNFFSHLVMIQLA